MLTMSTPVAYPSGMPVKRQTRSRRKTEARRKPKRGAYHHGDLERALVDAAVDMIRKEGVEAFTLRSVGARVGVSRTALYRHFDDKAALLARVASEGFRRLHAALAQAVAAASPRHADPLPAMAAAYVHFAARNPSHYETMFGGFLTDWSRYPDLVEHGNAAFDILADTIRGEQERGRIVPGDPIELAEITWSLSHGIATLGMAQHLARTPSSVEELAVLGCRFLQDGMRVPKSGIGN
jgi:AcrR family transcriptional regulator